MATFVLTARHDIDRLGGLHIDRGQQYTININMMGITPYNLFNNSRCRDAPHTTIPYEWDRRTK